jgi:prepilin signal peptidase PulO-like enzyme (type II secretory pathway)
LRKYTKIRNFVEPSNFRKLFRGGKMVLDMNSILYAAALGILGAISGSFFKSVIAREKMRMSALRGRSICPKCGHELGFWDLIPIFSFIFLRGKCRYCRQKISLQYPIVELVTALLFVFVAYFHSAFSFQLSAFISITRDLFFVSVLLLLFVFDLRYGIIPDRISVPAIALSVILGPALAGPITGSLFFHNILKMLLAIFAGGGFFLAQFLISKGKWVGGGDVRLGVLMGAMLSWPNILIALLLAYVAGAIYGIIAIILKKKTLRSTVPFGTFLAASTFITLFYGTEILNCYLRLLN